MDRRDFLKITGFTAAGLFVASSALKSLAKETIAKETIKKGTIAKGAFSDMQFSIEALVNDSEKAAAKIENFIKNNINTKYTIKYSELPFSSGTMGDIVFIHNNNLVDLIHPKYTLASELAEIRKSLALPNYIENPVRIRFYTDNTGPLKKVFVAQKGKVISTLPLNKDEEYTYYGKSGKLVVKSADSNFAVIKSECKHQICSRMGRIEKPGDYIACIPNEIQIFSE
jgi:hypothetical protein